MWRSIPQHRSIFTRSVHLQRLSSKVPIGHRTLSSTKPSTSSLRLNFPTNPILRGLAIIGVSFGVVTASCGTCLIGLLIYDSTTYSDRHLDRVPTHTLSLTSHRGGPKNLKIADDLLGDHDDDDQNAQNSKKPKLVIIGGGWGGVGLINSLDPDNYHVVVIAPENYNLFTPLLPSATVGTVETRTLVEPIRKIVARVKGHYLQGSAVDIDLKSRLVEVKPTVENQEAFYVPYDKLVISVGSVSNTHGVPGLNNCSQLKTINDVREIRSKIINNLETANLPAVEEEERKRLLSFVVCGGGPTGVEFASELYDMITEDMLKYFPKLLGSEVSIHLIQSRDHILNTYSEKISQYAEKRFAKAEIDTILNARVKEITPTSVTYTNKTDKKEHTIPAGFVLWSTGIAMNPFTKKVAGYLPNQYHKHALEVDSQLRLIDPRCFPKLVDQCDKNGDGQIDFEEFEMMMKHVRRKFPTSQMHIEKVRDVFEKYDADHDNNLGLNELAKMFQEISNRLTSLPATAQVANQEGKYLAKKFNKLVKDKEKKVENEENEEPFSYRHLGSLAYIGNSAVFDFGGNGSFAGGLIASYLWRSIYWSEQVSMRTRVLLMVDWIKRGIWGRDISKNVMTKEVGKAEEFVTYPTNLLGTWILVLISSKVICMV
ncbi:uncharacterized protein MELLADRAFT_110853 [Melampsora larici-populina 98AG31]|uniref:EF-hand domain-containing protein n=1 Tax=Melampsora larici-populina (strain 98AG31 / pathotype 3-4-7) TaxID=747676 RepID=F4S173_MELLP|nr:uncharacterized protein MELLADRAFT_110853 [Melampsora larici-populina 98AG31]EGG01614.1 hypothetical protein MELLADRAFT_110853 [Melampsora larici-populina 98AG31]